MAPLVGYFEVSLPILLGAAAPVFPRFTWEGAGTFLSEGGPFTYMNLAALVFAVGVGVERSVTLRLRFQLPSEPFLERISGLVEAGNRERALQLCASVRGAPLVSLFAAGLTESPGTDAGAAIDHAFAEQRARVHARNGWMKALGNVATLVGILGTCFGLMETFQALGDVAPELKQPLLSQGMARAMNNAALGLTIATGCLLAHLGLRRYSDTMVSALAVHAERLKVMLASRPDGEGSSETEAARAS